jgi:nicotinamide mononucleotide (NMN) deamidase PncC
LLFSSDPDGVNMRKPADAAVAATTPSPPVGGRDDAPVKLVCLALALAVLVLAFRIATFW